MSTVRPPAETAAGALLPRILRVRRRRRELAGVWTLELAVEDGEPPAFAPGQFAMLTVFGVGEVPISFSGRTGDGGPVHTVRAVGAVSAALCARKTGTVLGWRGPYGRGWPLEEAGTGAVVVVAGGLGLAPLRPAIEAVLAAGGRLVLLYGARRPEEILFAADLARWRKVSTAQVEVTVDHAGPDWPGHVGVVTRLLPRARFDPGNALALVCGPEIMMRFAVASLREAGLADSRIFLSLERNMKCAVGFCGHCQLGPHFVCRDGPVLSYDRLAPLLHIGEL